MRKHRSLYTPASASSNASQHGLRRYSNFAQPIENSGRRSWMHTLIWRSQHERLPVAKTFREELIPYQECQSVTDTIKEDGTTLRLHDVVVRCPPGGLPMNCEVFLKVRPIDPGFKLDGKAFSPQVTTGHNCSSCVSSPVIITIPLKVEGTVIVHASRTEAGCAPKWQVVPSSDYKVHSDHIELTQCTNHWCVYQVHCGHHFTITEPADGFVFFSVASKYLAETCCTLQLRCSYEEKFCTEPKGDFKLCHSQEETLRINAVNCDMSVVIQDQLDTLKQTTTPFKEDGKLDSLLHEQFCLYVDPMTANTSRSVLAHLPIIGPWFTSRRSQSTARQDQRPWPLVLSWQLKSNKADLQEGFGLLSVTPHFHSSPEGHKKGSTAYPQSTNSSTLSFRVQLCKHPEDIRSLPSPDVRRDEAATLAVTAMWTSSSQIFAVILDSSLASLKTDLKPLLTSYFSHLLKIDGCVTLQEIAEMPEEVFQLVCISANLDHSLLPNTKDFVKQLSPLLSAYLRLTAICKCHDVFPSPFGVRLVYSLPRRSAEQLLKLWSSEEEVCKLQQCCGDLPLVVTGSKPIVSITATIGNSKWEFNPHSNSSPKEQPSNYAATTHSAVGVSLGTPSLAASSEASSRKASSWKAEEQPSTDTAVSVSMQTLSLKASSEAAGQTASEEQPSTDTAVSVSMQTLSLEASSEAAGQTESGFVSMTKGTRGKKLKPGTKLLQKIPRWISTLQEVYDLADILLEDIEPIGGKAWVMAEGGELSLQRKARDVLEHWCRRSPNTPYGGTLYDVLHEVVPRVAEEFETELLQEY